MSKYAVWTFELLTVVLHFPSSSPPAFGSLGRLLGVIGHL